MRYSPVFREVPGEIFVPSQNIRRGSLRPTPFLLLHVFKSSMKRLGCELEGSDTGSTGPRSSGYLPKHRIFHASRFSSERTARGRRQSLRSLGDACTATYASIRSPAPHE